MRFKNIALQRRRKLRRPRCNRKTTRSPVTQPANFGSNSRRGPPLPLPIPRIHAEQWSQSRSAPQDLDEGQVGYERSGKHAVAIVSPRRSSRSSGKTAGGSQSCASGAQRRAMVFCGDRPCRLLLRPRHVCDQSYGRSAKSRDFLPERSSHRTAQRIVPPPQ